MVLETTEIQILSYLIIASGVAIAVKYIKLPYTIALVLTGLVLGTLNLLSGIELSEELIFFIFLPPLLFEGTLNMDLEQVRESAKVITLLSLVGIVVSTLTIGFMLFLILKLPFSVALLFGAIISPTDPISVLAIFRKLGVPKKLSLIVEGESVFNDGTGVVVFGILFSFLRTQQSIDYLWGLIEFFKVVIGGIIVGVFFGYLTYKILGKIDDHLIEIMITIILAYGTFILAEFFSVSGVIAVAFSGLIMGNYGRIFSMSPTTKVALISFWEFGAFMVNSLIFILIGTEIHLERLLESIAPILVAILAVFLGRAAVIYPSSKILELLKERLPMNWRHIIFWGGLRGSIPLALTLGLPKEFIYRETLLTLTYGVVLFSLLGQGLTMERLINFLKISKISLSEREYEKKIGMAIATKEAARELERMQDAGHLSSHVYEVLSQKLSRKSEKLALEISKLEDESGGVGDMQMVSTKRRLFLQQKATLQNAFRRGLISEEVLRELIYEIDTKIDLLEEGIEEEEKKSSSGR
ncbi:MAG: Na+/H+ antiporter [Candidatus Methanofastidiosia archaeon]